MGDAESVVIYQNVYAGADPQFEVWCGVDGDNIINAHIIGEGATRQEAVQGAVTHLESLLEVLQSPPGVVREQVIR